MKAFRRALLFLAALLAVGGLLALRWPEVLFNTAMLPTLMRATKLAGIETTWRTGSLEVESPTWFRKRVAIGFDGLCAIRETGPGMKACFERFRLSFVIDFSETIPRGPKIEVLGPGELLGGEILVSEASDSRGQPGKAPPRKRPSRRRSSAAFLIPSLLSRTSYEPIRIQLTRFDLPELRGALAAELEKNASAHPDVRFSGHARLGMSESPESSDEITARGHLRLAQAPGERSVRAVILEHDVTGTFRSGGTRISLTANGRVTGAGLDTVVAGRADGLLDELPWLSVRECRLRLSEDRTLVDCPTEAPLAFVPRGLRRVERLPLPRTAALRVHADLATRGIPPSFDSPVSGRVEIRLERLSEAGIATGRGLVQAEVAGIPGRFPEGWRLDTDLDVALSFPRFSALVSGLDGTPFAVPAPFRALEGEVRILAAGKADLLSGRVPLRVETRLRSRATGGAPGQRFDVDAAGMLESSGKGGPWEEMRLSAEVRLREVVLQLPRLAYEAPPRLLRDPRFQPFGRIQAGRAPSPPAQLPEEAYRVSVRTPPENPLKLLSNLAKAPVPITLDLQLTSADPPAGSVSIGQVPVSLFRRDATLERFSLALKKPTRDSELRGTLRIDYADYIMTVTLLGTVGKPALRLNSDPPLPENQLWAALLFGRPLEELEPEQSSSVVNTRAAVAEGAMTLASLYVLASTPIQALSYDPSTGVLTMKVRLAEGTSLNIGSEAGAFQQLGIRRRLGPHWTLSTDLYRDAEDPDASNEVSTFLEWHNRY